MRESHRCKRKKSVTVTSSLREPLISLDLYLFLFVISEKNMRDSCLFTRNTAPVVQRQRNHTFFFIVRCLYLSLLFACFSSSFARFYTILLPFLSYYRAALYIIVCSKHSTKDNFNSKEGE